MKPIHINRNIAFKFSRTYQQTCLYCQGKMGKSLGVCFNNAGDDLVLKKNLWLHIGCVIPFCKLLIKSLKEHGQTLLSEAI